MLYRRVAVLAASACIACLAAGNASAAFVADGSLSDWGVTLGDNNTSNWGVAGAAGAGTNHTGVRSTGGFNFKYNLEDNHDLGPVSDPLGPNLGGQRYDAEFLGVGVSSGHLAIAIATGQRTTNEFENFSPGDIRITTSNGIFGVEVGAGGTLGATYALRSTGATRGVLYSDGSSSGSGLAALGTARSDQVAGTLWKDSLWIQDPIAPPTDTQLQFSGGSLEGSASSFVYTNVGAQHAVLELAIDLTLFGGGVITRVEWAPSCGNDLVEVDGLRLDSDDPGGTGVPVPVPGGLALLGSALLSFCGYRSVRRKTEEDVQNA